MEITIKLDSAHKRLELFGQADSHLRLLRKDLGVRITAREDYLIVAGKDSNVAKAAAVIDKMQKHLLKHRTLASTDVSGFISQDEQAKGPEASRAITVFSKKNIEPNTLGQAKYVETMLANDLTFCIGPAGTP